MLIVCRGISLGGPAAPVTECFDLTVSHGDVCTIIGSSGSGKTRLCQLLSGMEQPVRGAITVDGLNTSDHAVEIRQRVTHVVPQAPLWPGRSTMSNVEYILRLCGLPGPSDDEVIHALRLAEVPDRLFRAPVKALSHLHRFGVWLAIHRLRQTPVLLMDDPFLKLTGLEIESLARLIQETVNSGGCAIITSGTSDVPVSVADRRYRIAGGQLVSIKTPTSWLDDANTTLRPSPGHAS
ncbi:MAG TPA: ATP-binding cassette domain-containing protein [Vicinamibacterales bacterium]|nr:ATP-binding cassette domain-containing protein [Vicinamibacterales bacterium]